MKNGFLSLRTQDFHSYDITWPDSFVLLDIHPESVRRDRALVRLAAFTHSACYSGCNSLPCSAADVSSAPGFLSAQKKPHESLGAKILSVVGRASDPDDLHRRPATGGRVASRART